MAKNKFIARLVASLTAFTMTTHSVSALNVPPTPKHPVTNTYHGTAVVDDYIWLEKFDDPATKAWNAAQNKVTRGYLDHLSARPKIATRLKKLYSATSANYSGLVSRPGVLFAAKFKPPAQQPWIVAFPGSAGILPAPGGASPAAGGAPALPGERAVLDPNKLNPKGTTAIDWYVPSLDGKKIAVSLSENGSEDGTLFIYDVATGEPLPDRIPRVQYPTGGGSVAWNADGTGVYYTRYPNPGERPAEDEHFYQQV
jgi:prolyl oligopeptidase